MDFKTLKSLLTGWRLQRALEKHQEAADRLDAAVKEMLEK